MKPNSKPISRKKKGFVIVTGGVMLLFVIPIVGLAIDASFLFAVKARLQSATDASALAAARSLSVGLTMAEQQGAAVSRAQAFFAANYPPGLFNTTSRNLSVDVAETGFRTRTVTVTAAVDSPLFFMRILVNSPTTIVSATGRASRRDVNVILVLDRSGSMNSNGGCPAMRSAAKGFVNLFANQRDRLAMITFGISYALSYPANMNFKTSSPTLPAVIDTITCSGGTGIAQALFKGYEQIAQINEPGALNVILLFTDGVPNTVTADFPVNRLDTTRVADNATLPQSPKNSRCYDWNNTQRWTKASPYLGQQNPSWNPTNEFFRGAVYSQEGLSGGGNTLMGVVPYIAPGFSDPSGVVTYAYNSAVNPPTQYSSPSNTGDCWFQGGRGHNGNSQGTGTGHVQYDIAYYPDRDTYGTSLRSADNFVPVNNFPGSNPYAGKIDVRDKTNMMNAAIAAADNVGKRIRNQDLAPNVNTVVYTIGLGETQANQETLLKRIANDAASPIYDQNKLEGLFVYAPTAADLNAAFVRIAAEILRFTH
ncbi:MAG: VWA domain-containing protein [Bryobacterales bacterium]|nr:VWA domain-containing protein [Bryobacterales bacterium]